MAIPLDRILHALELGKELAQDPDDREVFRALQTELGVASSEATYPEYVSKGAAIVNSREELYGSPVPQMHRLADAFSAVLGTEVTPVQVCMLFVVLKVVREAHGEHQDDNLDDIEGYVEIARRVVSEDRTHSSSS